MKTKSSAPMSREEAISKLIEFDVAKWGESEREASQEMRGRLSHGLALNALAVYDPENIDKALMKAASALFTAEDKRVIRSGG